MIHSVDKNLIEFILNKFVIQVAQLPEKKSGSNSSIRLKKYFF